MAGSGVHYLFLLYSLVIGLVFHGEVREGLAFRSCRGGVGRGSRVDGRDWAFWSGKTLELIDFGVALQKWIVFCNCFEFL